jgi:hypothetical protein
MAKKADPKAVRAAAKAAGINTPYWFRVVGNRLEVQPLGGTVINFPFPLKVAPAPIPDITVTGDVSTMKRDELRDLARTMQIKRAGSMTKAQLVQAIGAAQ